MNKDKIQEQLKKAKIIQEDIKEGLCLMAKLSGRVNKSVDSLRAQLAEKPELRHWDLVLDGQSKPHIVIADMDKVLQVAGPTFLCTVGVEQYSNSKIGHLQDYFDELKARQQPLEKVKMQTNNCGSDSIVHIGPTRDPKDYFGLYVTGVHASNHIWFSAKQLKEFALDIQRLLYTAENK